MGDTVKEKEKKKYEIDENYSPEQTEPASDAEDLLLRKCFKDQFPHQYIPDSVDNFLDFKIQECISAQTIDLGGGNHLKMEVGAIRKPSYVGSDSKKYPLYPRTAETEHKTYGVRIPVKLSIVNAKGKKVGGKPISMNLMTNMIIPVYSKYCHMHHVIQYNKNPDDPGCYFIINGKKYVVLLFEKSRYYQYFIGVDKDKRGYEPLPYISQSGEVAASSFYSAIRIFRDSKGSFTARFDLAKFAQDKSDWEKNKAEKKKKNKRIMPDGINVIAMIYIVLYSGAQQKYFQSKRSRTEKFEPPKPKEAYDIFETITKQFIPKEQLAKCDLVMAGVKAEYLPLSVKGMLTTFFTCLGINTRTDDIKSELMYQYIRQKVYPAHDDSDDKIKMIITMNATLYQHRAGFTPQTDVGHWGTMSLWPAGSILLKIFRKKFSALARYVTDSTNRKDTPSEIADIIKNFDFEGKFMTEFRALPGKSNFSLETKGQGPKDKAVAILVSPLNTSDLRSMLTKTRNNASKNTHLYRPRGVEGSFYGFICGHFTREDNHCGLTKWTAMTAFPTLGCKKEHIDEYIEILKEGTKHKKLKIGGVVSEYSSTHTIPVLVHGLLIGYTHLVGIANMIIMKRYNILDRMCSVVYHGNSKKCVELSFDPNRLLVPLVVCDMETDDEKYYGRPKLEQDPNWKTRTFQQLVERGYIQYLDNYEIENVGPGAINLAQSFASFENIKKDEEMILEALVDAARSGFDDKSHYVSNLNFELNSIKKDRPNYALLHPIAAYGIVTAMGQFVNGNQPCRTAYAGKHTTQDIENIMNNPYLNVNRLTAFYSIRSRVKSFVHEAMGLSEETHGHPVIVIFLPQYKNQEDSCIVSKSAVDNGKLSFNNTIVISETLSQEDEKFGRFNNGSISSYRYRLINESGFPTVGMFANPDDVIISKIKTIVGGTNRPMLTKLAKDEYGFIEEVTLSRTTKTASSANQQLTVNVRLNCHTSSVAGNKVRTPHAQKFIISEIRPTEDMVWFPYLGGLRADVMMSTHSIPTRMTMGSLLEPLLQFISVLEGREFDTSGFRSYSIVELRNILRRHGFRDDGTHWAVDGQTGRKFKVPIFVGPARVHMLARIAENQVQCRTIGNRNRVTGQAESARSGDSRDKGQKFGEMERIQAIKYGASFLIAERMNISCDQVPVVVCKDCSSYAKFNGSLAKFSCPNCGIAAEGRQCRDQFGQFMHSQSAIYLELLAQSMGIEIKTRYGTAKDLMNAAVNEESSSDESHTHSSEDSNEESNSDEDWI